MTRQNPDPSTHKISVVTCKTLYQFLHAHQCHTICQITHVCSLSNHICNLSNHISVCHLLITCLAICPIMSANCQLTLLPFVKSSAICLSPDCHLSNPSVICRSLVCHVPNHLSVICQITCLPYVKLSAFHLSITCLPSLHYPAYHLSNYLSVICQSPVSHLSNHILSSVKSPFCHLSIHLSLMSNHQSVISKTSTACHLSINCLSFVK